MPQTWLQWLRGYLQLTVDTLSQRATDRFVHAGHPVFTDNTYLQGKTAIVTGANTGIGYETTRMLCAAGAHVILACRSQEKAHAAIAKLQKTNPVACAVAKHIDLSSLSSVRAFATEINGDNAYSSIDMLILNGGVMAVPHTKPETHFMVNHIAHALLVLLLLPLLARAPSASVVFVSSLTLAVSDIRFEDLHFEARPYAWMTAYANSKLAMVLFMRALCQRLRCKNIQVNAVHPGESPSDVARYLGPVWSFLHKTFGPLFLLSVSHSARTSVYVSGAREITSSGTLFHRVSRPLRIPQHLVHDEHVERMWESTINAAQVTDKDLVTLQPILTTYSRDQG